MSNPNYSLDNIYEEEFCVDCLFANEYGLNALQECESINAVRNGLESMYNCYEIVSPAPNSEGFYSKSACDCCGSHTSGSRTTMLCVTHREAE